MRSASHGLPADICPQSVSVYAAAAARATVANQPTFDAGGFPVRVREVLRGESQLWETLEDSVSIFAVPRKGNAASVALSVSVQEDDAPALPTSPRLNCAGRAILFALEILEQKRVLWSWDLHVIVRKGVTLMGKGLGSSGASAAAGLRAFEELMSRVGITATFTRPERVFILTHADCGIPDNSVPSYAGGWCVLGLDNGYQRIDVHPSFGSFVVASPRGFDIAMADARRILPPPPSAEVSRSLLRTMVRLVEEGDGKAYGQLMEEAHAWFVEPRSTLYPRHGAVYHEAWVGAKEAGAWGFTMSGAGPAVLALVPNDTVARTVSNAIGSAFERAGYSSIIRVCDIADDGARVVPLATDECAS